MLAGDERRCVVRKTSLLRKGQVIKCERGGAQLGIFGRGPTERGVGDLQAVEESTSAAEVNVILVESAEENLDAGDDVSSGVSDGKVEIERTVFRQPPFSADSIGTLNASAPALRGVMLAEASAGEGDGLARLVRAEPLWLGHCIVANHCG